MKVTTFLLKVCIIFILLSSTNGLYAATIKDRIGDFDDTDVSSVQIDIQGQVATFTVTYAEAVIDFLSGGAGGIFGIDSDRNLRTGLENSRGFDRQLTYNVLALAPTAQLDIWTGPRAGDTVKVGAEFGNGTNLSFTDRTVTLVVPLQFLGTDGDFDFALFATGLFSTGDKWDRVPDQGVARSLTGEVSFLPVAGNKAPHTFQAQPPLGGNPLVQSVTTSVEGENAVWIIQTGVDLSGRSFVDNSMTMTLLIDVDRRLETGIESSDIPFLPFGPDRNVRCTFTPGGAASVDIIVGIKDNGERVGRGGGAGVNDLLLVFDQRQARLVVPLWLLDLNNTAFDWMLVTTSTQQGRAPETFLGTSVSFDTGKRTLALDWPVNTVVVSDPIDAKTEIKDAGGKEIGGLKWHTLPNSELRQLKAALRPGYLMAQITYENPMVLQPQYLTSLDVFVPVDGGTRRNFLVAVNWHPFFGGQALLRELSEGADVTRTIPLDQCLATRGKDVFLLLPEAVFGQNAFKRVELSVETNQIAYSVVAGRTTNPKPSGAKDPIEGYMRYGAHIGLVAGGQTTQRLDRLPDNGTVSLSSSPQKRVGSIQVLPSVINNQIVLNLRMQDVVQFPHGGHPRFSSNRTALGRPSSRESTSKSRCRS